MTIQRDLSKYDEQALKDAAAGQVRGHLLDIYLPHEAAVRMSNVTPVYVDIHGGVFSLASPERAAGRGVAYGTERKNLESTLGPGFFAGLDAADPDFLTAPEESLRTLADIRRFSYDRC